MLLEIERERERRSVIEGILTRLKASHRRTFTWANWERRKKYLIKKLTRMDTLVEIA